jgi:hypothetical protein
LGLQEFQARQASELITCRCGEKVGDRTGVPRSCVATMSKACCGAHYRARRLIELGYDVWLIAPQHRRPLRLHWLSDGRHGFRAGAAPARLRAGAADRGELPPGAARQQRRSRDIRRPAGERRVLGAFVGANRRGCGLGTTRPGRRKRPGREQLVGGAIRVKTRIIFPN